MRQVGTRVRHALGWLPVRLNGQERTAVSRGHFSDRFYEHRLFVRNDSGWEQRLTRFQRSELDMISILLTALNRF